MESEKYFQKRTVENKMKFTYEIVELTNKGQKFLKAYAKSPEQNKIMLKPIPELFKQLKPIQP